MIAATEPTSTTSVPASAASALTSSHFTRSVYHDKKPGRNIRLIKISGAPVVGVVSKIKSATGSLPKGHSVESIDAVRVCTEPRLNFNVDIGDLMHDTVLDLLDLCADIVPLSRYVAAFDDEKRCTW
jgi:hypothetical protein